MYHIPQIIKRYLLIYPIICSFVGLSTTLAATSADHTDALERYDYILQIAPHHMRAITQEAYLNSEDEHKAPTASPLPIDQLLIPANGQCLYTTLIMGYLLPVREDPDKVLARIDQLFGMQPAYYLNELHQTLQNPTHHLTYLHSYPFSSLVTDFMTRMQIKKGTWGGPQEIQTIANKLKINIQEYFPDPSNPTTLIQSDITKPAQEAATITLHIVRDKVHPAEVLIKEKRASVTDNPHYQHYRPKHTLSPASPSPLLPSTPPPIPHKTGSLQKSPMPPYLVRWFEAAETGNRKLLGTLYHNYNINANTRNEDNHTALLLSAWGGHLDCVNFLLQKNADLNDKNAYGNTPLILSTYNGHLACVKSLVERDADIKHQNKTGYTALLYSAREGYLPIVQYLIDQGADIHAENVYGHTPFILSAHNQHLDCVNFLLPSVDLHKLNLQGINFSQVALPQNLSGLDFTDAKLPQDLTNHNLIHANLTGNHFTDTNFEGTQLEGVILTNSLCDYQQCFQDHIEVNKLCYAKWYSNQLSKDLKSIAQVYPLLSQDRHKAELLEIASGLAYLPDHESKSFYIKLYYWSCKLILFKKQLSSALATQLVCTLANNKDLINYEVKNCCWQTDYLQDKLEPTQAAPHDDFDQYLKTFQAGLEEYHCQSKEIWAYNWYKTNIEKTLQSLQNTYPQLTDPKQQQEAMDIAFQLSTLYQHQHFSLLFRHISLQNRLIRMKILDGIKTIHYARGIRNPHS